MSRAVNRIMLQGALTCKRDLERVRQITGKHISWSRLPSRFCGLEPRPELLLEFRTGPAPGKCAQAPDGRVVAFEGVVRGSQVRPCRSHRFSPDNVAAGAVGYKRHGSSICLRCLLVCAWRRSLVSGRACWWTRCPHMLAR